jgi:anti-sigma regulatory factor (Ser/Thr protein kinase)
MSMAEMVDTAASASVSTVANKGWERSIGIGHAGPSEVLEEISSLLADFGVDLRSRRTLLGGIAEALSNIMDHVPSGLDAKVALAMWPGERISIIVEDAGPGLPSTEIGRLTDSDGAFAPQRTGRGQGLLAIARGARESGTLLEILTPAYSWRLFEAQVRPHHADKDHSLGTRISWTLAAGAQR